MMREGEFMKTILKLMVLSMLILSIPVIAQETERSGGSLGEQRTPPDPASIDCEENVVAPGSVQDGEQADNAREAG